MLTELLDTNTFMSGGIKIQTAQSYERALKEFASYLGNRGSHARVTSVLMEGASVQDQVLELVGFIQVLSQRKTISESAFDECINAIRRNMLQKLKSVEAFEWESVKEARRNGRRIVRASRQVVISEMTPEDRNRYEARYADKLPFTEEMVIECRRKNWESKSATIEDQMAYMGVAVGYHFGNRPSETSSNGPLAINQEGNSDADHRYTEADVRLQCEDLSWIDSLGLTPDNRVLVNYISMMVDSHKGETLKMAGSAKKSQKRQPNAVRRDAGGLESQLFQDILDWITMAKLRKGDFFFSRNTAKRDGTVTNLKLTTKALTTMMKSTASSQGIDPNRISAKSLRKALGSSLTHSNIPKGIVNSIGRWSKDSNVCAQHYVSGHGEVTGAMSAGVKRVTNEDISHVRNTRR